MFVPTSQPGSPTTSGAVKCRVVLMTRDEQTANRIVQTMESHRLASPRRCTDMVQLAERLETGDEPVAVVLVDADPDPKRVFSELEPIINRCKSTRFVIVSASFESGHILEAMQIGARHYLAKSNIDSELMQVIDRLGASATKGGSGKRGAVVSVLSAGGGCGATTVAINLADELRDMTASPTMVIDMDNAYGGVGAFFGMEGQFGIADVLDYGGAIDGALISSTASHVSENLHALTSPVSTNFSHPPGLRLDRLPELIAASRDSYAWTVVDAPRMPIDRMAQVVDASRMTLIVAQLSVKDIRLARSLWLALNERGVAVDTIRVVINRYRKRGSAIELEEARKALNDAPMMQLSNDFRAASDSANLGKPLSVSASRSQLRRDIRQLAQSVVSANRMAEQHQG